MRVVRSIFAAALVAGGLAAAAATAAPALAATPDLDAAACVASGLVTHTPIGPVPAPATFNVALETDCEVAGSGDDGGVWYVSATAGGSLDSCAAGAGFGTITGGSSPHDGTVTGGSLTYARVGLLILVEGQVQTSGDTEAHTFTADLAYLPNGLGCPDSGGGTLSGTAQFVDGVTIPPIIVPPVNPPPVPDVDGAPCTVQAVFGYSPGLSTVAVLATTGVNAGFFVDCAGLTDEAGSWMIAAGGSTTASCAEETATGVPVASGTAAGGDGTVSGGSLTWARVGPVLAVAGLVFTGGEQHHFSAVVSWVPQGSVTCGGSPTVAFGSGVGAIVDDNVTA